jgi:acetyl-CoA acetyltransferase
MVSTTRHSRESGNREPRVPTALRDPAFAGVTTIHCRAARPAPLSPSVTPPPASPLNTNGGGLSYMHSGMYGMCALQESVRQMRGTAPAQIPGAKISVCHGVRGMFAASGTTIMSNEPP